MKENSIEEAIERIAKLITTKFNNDYSIDNVDKEAIEELLKAYKELEEKNRKLKEHCKEQIKDKQELTTALLDSIPVSLVEEKIEELKEAYEDSKDENGESQYYYPDYTIRVLEGLLEKRK